jgi:hypothetical protein
MQTVLMCVSATVRVLTGPCQMQGLGLPSACDRTQLAAASQQMASGSACVSVSIRPTCCCWGCLLLCWAHTRWCGPVIKGGGSIQLQHSDQTICELVRMPCSLWAVAVAYLAIDVVEVICCGCLLLRYCGRCWCCSWRALLGCSVVMLHVSSEPHEQGSMQPVLAPAAGVGASTEAAPYSSRKSSSMSPVRVSAHHQLAQNAG